MKKTLKIFIEAQDCLPIICDEEKSRALSYFFTEIEPNIYHFGNNNKAKEPVVYFDYQNKKWMANRYIGECEFIFNNKNYVLRIQPRFGHELLLKLFEYIYATKLPPSYHSFAQKRAVDIHKLVISLMWISLLKKALKHGLLKENRKIKEEGATIRGKFLVKESLINIKVKNALSYQYQYKNSDNVPNKIMYKAYLILKQDYFLNDSLLSNQIKSDFTKLKALFGTRIHIVPSEYSTIKFNNMYAGYKALIDLSWKIINFKEFGIDNSRVLGNSFYLDMAEVWELFVHRILTKTLIPKGWRLLNSKHEIYSDTFYKRKIIPDLVLENNRSIFIVDAKYKRMKFQNWDVDRNDLFQIHTYSYYFDEPHKNVYATLVYPLEQTKDSTLDRQIIFNKLEHKNSFFIEGVDVVDSKLFDQNIETFINSIYHKITSP